MSCLGCSFSDMTLNTGLISSAWAKLDQCTEWCLFDYCLLTRERTVWIVLFEIWFGFGGGGDYFYFALAVYENSACCLQRSRDTRCSSTRVSPVHHQGFPPSHWLLWLWDRPAYAHTGTGLLSVCLPPLAGQQFSLQSWAKCSTERPLTLVYWLPTFCLKAVKVWGWLGIYWNCLFVHILSEWYHLNC